MRERLEEAKGQVTANFHFQIATRTAAVLCPLWQYPVSVETLGTPHLPPNHCPGSAKKVSC